MKKHVCCWLLLPPVCSYHVSFLFIKALQTFSKATYETVCKTHKSSVESYLKTLSRCWKQQTISEKKLTCQPVSRSSPLNLKCCNGTFTQRCYRNYKYAERREEKTILLWPYLCWLLVDCNCLVIDLKLLL